MLCSRHVLATVFLFTLSIGSASGALYTRIKWYDSGCSNGGIETFLKNGACHNRPDGGSFLLAAGTGFVADPTHMQVWGSTPGCQGSPDFSVASNDVATCQTGDFKLVTYNYNGEPSSGGRVRKRISYAQSSCSASDTDQLSEGLPNTCLPSGLSSPLFKYVKYVSKPISSTESLVTEALYADDACTQLSWASQAAMNKGCTTSAFGTGPDMTCTVAPCPTLYPTGTGSWAVAFLFGAETKTDVRNYVKLRFYQDEFCTHPTTYEDPGIKAIAGRTPYDGANVPQTGVLNTDGTYFRPGEQVGDFNAPGQSMYLELISSGTYSCTVVELGDNMNTINSISCQGGSQTQCQTFNSVDCSGTVVSTVRPSATPRFWITTTAGTFADNEVITGTDSAAYATIKFAQASTSLIVENIVGVFQPGEVIKTGAGHTGTFVSRESDCDPNLFAKVEEHETGIQRQQNDFQIMSFAAVGSGVRGIASNPSLAQECGGKPAIVTGLLDTCHVQSLVSYGHTWNAPTEQARCSYDFDNQYAAATIEDTVDSCKARCKSDVTCLAISWGRDGRSDNHKCMLCQDVTLEGHASWDTYTKNLIPVFAKITTGTHGTKTYETTMHTDADCSGKGVTAFHQISRMSTCRSVPARMGHSRGSGNDAFGSIMLASSMSSEEIVTAVLGQGVHPDGDAFASDEIGCPNAINYVYTDGLYTIGATNSASQHRKCSVLFQAPPGNTLSFEWSNFALSTGSCNDAVPANCICTSETVTIRDGLAADSRQIGQAMCGSYTPNRIMFSRSTARIDFEAISDTSTFAVLVTHHSTKVNFHLPKNPAFALGSMISIDWSLESSVGGWPECGTGAHQQTGLHGIGRTTQDETWQRRLSCARSSAKDHGWVGIYRNGTCESGAMAPLAEDPHDSHSLTAGFRANAYAATQMPHECYLGYHSIPVLETRGTVQFKYMEDYRDAGWYSLRYFSGDGQGRVCEVLESSSATDPEETKNLQCQLEPITQAEIYITPDSHTFSGATRKLQVPGFEKMVNW